MKRALLLLVILILVGAALNLAVATRFIPGRRTAARPTTIVNDFGPAAAARAWPAATPHDQPWPAPSQFQMDGRLGYRYFNVFGEATDPERSGRVQMQVERMGWPLPALEQVMMWWTWDDPAWATSADPAPPLHLYWPGVIGNPLIFGGTLWIVFVLPPLLFFTIRRRLRDAHNCCPKCGHPCAALDVCTECGHAFARTTAIS